MNWDRGNSTLGTYGTPEQSVHSYDVDVDLRFILNNPNVALDQIEGDRKLIKGYQKSMEISKKLIEREGELSRTCQEVIKRLSRSFQEVIKKK